SSEPQDVRQTDGRTHRRRSAGGGAAHRTGRTAVLRDGAGAHDARLLRQPAARRQSRLCELGHAARTGFAGAWANSLRSSPGEGIVAVALAGVDAVVIGAGAGGGVIAKELATAGLRVVLLERGRWETAW